MAVSFQLYMSAFAIRSKPYALLLLGSGCASVSKKKPLSEGYPLTAARLSYCLQKVFLDPLMNMMFSDFPVVKLYCGYF